jgi:hypothetical protein
VITPEGQNFPALYRFRTVARGPAVGHGIAKLAFYDDLSLFVSMKRAGLSAAAPMIAKVFFLA